MGFRVCLCAWDRPQFHEAMRGARAARRFVLTLIDGRLLAYFMMQSGGFNAFSVDGDGVGEPVVFQIAVALLRGAASERSCDGISIESYVKRQAAEFTHKYGSDLN